MLDEMSFCLIKIKKEDAEVDIEFISTFLISPLLKISNMVRAIVGIHFDSSFIKISGQGAHFDNVVLHSEVG